MTIPQDNLLTRLTQANVCCSECGLRYGKYSVGCSSVYIGTCDVCGKVQPVTETRDYGYLVKGINELRGTVKEQSKQVADYLLSVGPVMDDEALDGIMSASYEKGDLTLKLTEEEVVALATLIDDVSDKYPPGQDVNFDSAFEKITELYEDNCVRYELSPALKSYHAKYGTWGNENDEEMRRWEGFRDAFVMLHEKNV